jgi:hypothetical protein
MTEVETRTDSDADTWLSRFEQVEKLYDNFGVVQVYLYRNKKTDAQEVIKITNKPKLADI